jgi:hypothetical protein
LADPTRLLAQFERFAQLAVEGDAHEQAETAQLTARLARLDREERRLVDAYQAEVISLEELADRRQHLHLRRQALEAQREQQVRMRRERAQAQEVLTDLTAFCARVRGRLADATLAERQAILQLLIERIIVGDDTLAVRHVIPLRGPDPDPARPGLPADGLRSDGVAPTALLHPWIMVVGGVAVAHQHPAEPRPQHRIDRFLLPTAPGERALGRRAGRPHVAIDAILPPASLIHPHHRAAPDARQDRGH